MGRAWQSAMYGSMPYFVHAVKSVTSMGILKVHNGSIYSGVLVLLVYRMAYILTNFSITATVCIPFTTKPYI